MKRYVYVLLALLTCVACKESVTANQNKDTIASTYDKQGAHANEVAQQSPYASFGAKISAESAMKPGEIAEKYADLKEGDTALVKFEAPINSVCKSKGCWMRLDAGGEEVFVKFKDYGFFVPLDAEGEAIVEGKAFLEEVTVDELRHLAKDAGKTQAEIAAITTPKRELRFMADGVLIKSK